MRYKYMKRRRDAHKVERGAADVVLRVDGRVGVQQRLHALETPLRRRFVQRRRAFRVPRVHCSRVGKSIM